MVERPRLHELASDPALDRLLAQPRIGGTGDLRCHHRQDRSEALATGGDQVRRNLVEVQIGSVHGLDECRLDASHIIGHTGQREERRRRHAVRLVIRLRW